MGSTECAQYTKESRVHTHSSGVIFGVLDQVIPSEMRLMWYGNHLDALSIVPKINSTLSRT